MPNQILYSALNGRARSVEGAAAWEGGRAGAVQEGGWVGAVREGGRVWRGKAGGRGARHGRSWQHRIGQACNTSCYELLNDCH
jgi:hypothetical protein